jgi:hypothetical protein
MSSLYEECIEALGEENIEVFSKENKERREIIRKFEDDFPITPWGRIDWSKVKIQLEVEYLEDIEDFLERNFHSNCNEVFIIWDNGMLPVLKADLDKIFDVMPDVLAVSFDTWLFSPSLGFAVEFHHEGETKIGLK